MIFFTRLALRCSATISPQQLYMQPRAVVTSVYTTPQAWSSLHFLLSIYAQHGRNLHPVISILWCSSLFFPFSAQGVGGTFTHFYPGTHHALDFECPEGTSVLALADGTVREVRQSNTAGGIHARGLFDWNSVRVCEGIRWGSAPGDPAATCSSSVQQRYIFDLGVSRKDVAALSRCCPHPYLMHRNVITYSNGCVLVGIARAAPGRVAYFSRNLDGFDILRVSQYTGT